jgi:hypothetical protein
MLKTVTIVIMVIKFSVKNKVFLKKSVHVYQYYVERVKEPKCISASSSNTIGITEA